MGVTKMEEDSTPSAGPERLHVHDESSDDNRSEDWGVDESDWRTSSSSEPAPRFSLLALPSKVRHSVFRRPAKPQRKTKDRSSTADTTRTSSASSTPRDSVLVARTQHECENVEKFRVFWDEKLRSTMERLAGSKAKDDEAADDLFHLLLKLYAHQDVVEELYSSYEANAAEFEFYIPQLCTFLLHGNYAKQHQLECFLMSRSGESLPFAHRLTWFLRSFCDDAREYQSEYLSVTARTDQENSDLLTAIGMRAGVPALLMNSGLCVEEVSAAKPGNLQRRRSILFPTDNELDTATLDTDESFAGHLLRKRNSIQDEARTEEGNSQQILLFKQTPKFVGALTDLAEQLIPTPRPQRNGELRKGLAKIEEQMLPSDVIYLPIGNSYHRVKGIRVDECFTFSTKERVPYFLCVEVLDYSVPSPTAGSKKQRKRRRSKASRNQSRVFSLRLPFKKTDSDLTIPVDDSPMSRSSKPPESELSFVPSPSVSSPLPEIEEEKGQVSSDSSAPLQDAGASIDEPLDGEVGDDEKEEGAQKARKSFLEGEDLQKAEEEQQERLGQWNLPPRPRRRSIKEYSSSASARSGGQFDSFYSTWFSKKALQEADEDFSAPRTQHVAEQTPVEDDAEEGVARSAKDDESSCIRAKSEIDVLVAESAEDVVNDWDARQIETSVEEATEGKTEVCEVMATESLAPDPQPVAAVAANGGIFSSLFSRKPKPETVAQQSEASSNQKEDQPEHHQGDASTVFEPAGVETRKAAASDTDPASAPPAQSAGIFSSLFSKKPTDMLAPASNPAETSVVVKNEVGLGETTEPSSDGDKPAAAPTAPVGIFASIFTKKPQANAEASVLATDGTDASVSSLEPSEEGDSDDVDPEDADGEESDSKEALPSDSDPADRTDVSVSSLDLSEGPVKCDLEAEDADGEDTDSNGGLFSDDESVACEPEPSPAKVPTEKAASFVSWFSRKPATELVKQATADNNEGAAASFMDNDVSPDSAGIQEISPLEVSEPAVEKENSTQDEDLLQQRRRDLSVSLDFADPTAWKEKFDLEDGLTDDEPDVEAADADAEEEDAGEEEEHIATEDDDEKPMIVFRERWSEKEARIRRESPFGDHPGWRLLSVIVKSNDDLRQEQFAAQLIAQCDRIFREYSLPLSLRPYNVIATSAKTGLIEAVPDTVSLDSLKRNDPGYTTLLDFYTRLHGDKETTGFTRAQRNFVESLAAYSIVCYVFQIKDRHNGNILVDTDGHVIHIDFGFLLTNSPGSNWNFERAPFKLTDEFVELMGGPRSSTFRYFRSLCIRAYLALRRNMDQIVLLVEMMLVGNADLPCFAGGKKAVIEGLRARLKPGARTSTCQVFVNQLIDQSINNWRTRWYDKYQRACLGIL
ncbi:Phosphatidylinositol 4-kinase beta [Phytophthora pseudosyringae]|uniref:1-phosphatidylinositol 4-kinase n=1 Tax=Phytophthora pseudosyringae TaxID=221518 RepID=A0A8T1VHA2_9STRA|nr:Phosphatidylinositol 4-kinase beta [Phytophthora pseudosyringae]